MDVDITPCSEDKKLPLLPAKEINSPSNATCPTPLKKQPVTFPTPPRPVTLPLCQMNKQAAINNIIEVLFQCNIQCVEQQLTQQEKNQIPPAETKVTRGDPSRRPLVAIVELTKKYISLQGKKLYR